MDPASARRVVYLGTGNVLSIPEANQAKSNEKGLDLNDLREE